MAEPEKSTGKQELEHIERQDTNTESSPSEVNLKEVNTHETFKSFDSHNRGAFKGDDSDGKVPWTLQKLLASAFLSMLYTGSQLPLYFAGALLSFISADIGGVKAMGWLTVANTLTIAAVCPFVGYLQDLFGKRYIALFGAMLLCVGCVILGTAQSLGAALAGMSLSGAGAGVGELTGLAGLAETVPVKHRGYSLAMLTAFVLPFCPYVLYSELFAPRSTWRWGAWICLIYNGITGIGLLLTYFPQRQNSIAAGLSRGAILKRIDYIGGFMSIVGLTLFLVALQAGGYSHPWSSAYVLCTLLSGLIFIIAWVIYEIYFARHPMLPPQLFNRTVTLSFAVAFVAGMNFFSLLNFWPLTITNVWDPKPVSIGLRGLPVGFSTAIGAIFWNGALSVWKGGARYILVIAATTLTAFAGSLAVLNPEREIETVALATVAAFGLGGVLVPAATVAMIAANDSLITTCAALSLSVRAVGGSIGYSIYFNIFQQKLTDKLPGFIAERAVGAGLSPQSSVSFVEAYIASPELAAQISGVNQAILDAALLGHQWAYVESLKYVWLTSVAFGCCAIIASAFVPDTSKYETNRVAVAL